MKKLLLILFVVLAVSIHAKEKQKYINVNGSAEVEVIADQMNINVNIKTIKNSIEESKKTNDIAVDNLINILNDFGIEKQSVEISPVSLGKNYEYKQGERVQNGYFTNVSVSILLKDLSKYYELIDKVSLNDEFEITNSNYSVSEYETHVKNAYEKALTAAKEKAAFMAKTLGVDLGEVLEIDENNSYGNPMPLNAMAKEDYQAGDIAGKVTINRNVRVKFGIM